MRRQRSNIGIDRHPDDSHTLQNLGVAGRVNTLKLVTGSSIRGLGLNAVQLYKLYW